MSTVTVTKNFLIRIKIVVLIVKDKEELQSIKFLLTFYSVYKIRKSSEVRNKPRPGQTYKVYNNSLYVKVLPKQRSVQICHVLIRILSGELVIVHCRQ